MNLKNLNLTENALLIGGGVAGEVLMNILDTKVTMFKQKPELTPYATLAAGLAGQMFVKKYQSAFQGLTLVAGLEILRKYGVISGVTDTLGDIIINPFERGDQVPQDNM